MFNETATSLRNVDTKKRHIRTHKGGKVVKMPTDDGYDEAFFFYLRNPSMSFEWLVHNTVGAKSTRGDNSVSINTLYKKLLECGYSPRFISIQFYIQEKNVEKYLEGVRGLLKA